ncbi:UBP-type zinc finger domain-containing protein [Caulobacter sp. DWR1-3-2b1]|uniref:UBP-type zinc finger domain-containing protein n=1 Tax=Caulobacter sp. DWR1-3-2b1 TaxID=2804670 RepID=UPI003CF19B61
MHLRLRRTCGHVGCCDDFPARHATAHFHATRHPSAKVMTRPRAGAGASSTRCSWSYRTRRHRTDRYRSSCEARTHGFAPSPVRPASWPRET